MAYMNSRGQIFEIAFNRSNTAMYYPTLMEPQSVPQQLRGLRGLGDASTMLPQNMYAVTYGDGSTGFMDPTDGTYYDSQGNDITSYVQNFGGAKVTGTATAASIQAAEGLAAPSVLQSISNALAPGPSPRVTVPTTPASAPTIEGIPVETLLLGGFALALVMMMAGRGRR